MLFSINGVELPTPAYGVNMQWSQLVDSGRNALGEVVAQKINRRQAKFDNLVWKHLKDEEWGKVLQEIEKFEGVLRFWDSQSQSFISRRVYWGDATAEIWKIDPASGKILEWTNCKCALIDMGYANI